MAPYSSESSAQIYAEATWLHGAIVAAMFYGVVVILSFTCWCSIWPRIRSHATGYRKNIFFFCYVTSLFVLGTLYMAFSMEETQKTFIYNRLFPGGPSAFARINFSLPLGVALLLANWGADILMIWRCIVVYKDTRLHYVYHGTWRHFVHYVFIGTIWLVIMSSPTKATSGWMSIQFLFPYTCIALTINIFISLLTALRLLYHRRRMSKILGPGHGAIYASFAAMIIESASIYSICSLLYLIPFAIHNPLSDAFFQILAEAQIVASLLIIYRVTEGKAWGKSVSTLNNSAVNSSLRMRRIPPTVAMTVPPDRLNVEINFDAETTSDGSKQLPKSRYSKGSTSEVDVPVGNAE
ncbi:hypothetical protein DEU56DRAFT_729175 [Suillus clintonianus]|uniref:uncharacterized protein n=1 Tax=Suillus clintonianus TaxID=1904413 RepID=UPI001B8862B5|nr:uncharacterized protein DEU56DRAFT_729175 [Suillus clintonianus]KAG2150465.1 hypothetical protein DEU56DRAFT_729175 [Suillus clintonianus]